MGESSILTKLQKRFLELVAAEKSLTSKYYWTGGTVLSEFYLHHRYSEDIDLFTENEEVQTDAISTFISRASKKMGAQKVHYTQFLGLHTYIFEFPKNSTFKVDFNYYPFPRLEKGGNYDGILFDSVLDIAVNKIQTISTKPRSRDFIDLYMILKKYNYELIDLMKKARLKFDWYTDPLQLAANFLLATKVTDFPKMLIKLPDKKWREYFLQKAKELKTEVF